MRSINIAMLCPMPNDATSIYRAWGPLNRLRKTMNLHLNEATDWKWHNMKNNDIVFLQRPFQPHHMEAAAGARHVGLPLWVDFDDNLLRVPKSNPFKGMYTGCERVVIKCVEKADVVTVSTQPLLEELSQFSDKVLLVPNAPDPDIWGEPDLSWKGRKNIVLWRGSETHAKDLFQWKDEFLESYESMRGNWKWAFLGWEPWMYTEHMDPNDFMFEPFKDYFSFVSDMKKIRPKIMIFPLEKNPFNMAKSTNVCDDAQWSGALLVTPYWFCHEKNCTQEMETAVNNCEGGYDPANVPPPQTKLDRSNDIRREIIESLVGK